MVKGVSLGTLQGRKLLSPQSPQERAHNGGGNHQPGWKCRGKGERHTDKKKKRIKTGREKEKRDITEKKGGVKRKVETKQPDGWDLTDSHQITSLIIHLFSFFFFLIIISSGKELSCIAFCCPSNIRFYFDTILHWLSLNLRLKMRTLNLLSHFSWKRRKLLKRGTATYWVGPNKEPIY